MFSFPLKQSEREYLLALNLLFPFINIERLSVLYVEYSGNLELVWKERFRWPWHKLALRNSNSLDLLKNKICQTVLEKELAQISKLGFAYITLADSNYPRLLAQIDNPPLVLYYKGNSDLFKYLSIAVVGTRRITSYGVNIVKRFIPVFCQENICIVSGLAYGVDTFAHQQALDCGGYTLAVLPSGLADVSPVGNMWLYRKIVDTGRGLVVTELPLNTSPKKYFFPLRSRIVVGLSQAVLVVEAAEKSGTIYTAEEAKKQGKYLYAVPGQLESAYSQGTNLLICNGATLARSPESMVDECFAGRVKGIVKASNDLSAFTKDEFTVYEALLRNDMFFDTFLEHSSLKADILSGVLTGLEIKGVVRFDKGKYSLCRHL